MSAPDDERDVTRRTSRDDDVLRERLGAWLAARLPADAGLAVSEIRSPSGSGMSSETLLFDAHWREGGAERGGSFVARMAPAASDVPVFPSYDLAMQARVMRLARAHGVPVPTVRWLEEDAAALGAPFFVMDRVEGRVPADVPTYLAEGWLAEASPAEQRKLQDATVGTIARLHAIDVASEDVGFLEFDVPGDTPLERHVANQRAYHRWMAEGETHPLIERAFGWLGEHWPDESSTVVSWGDSRIGNVMYAGFEPCAVLDWEMAGLGPRELDLGWLVFMHAFFQDLFSRMGVAGMPHFLRAEDVAETYARASDHAVADLRWFVTYGALRHAIIMTRIAARMVHFGQAERAPDPDDRFPHRAMLEAMLDGSYWEG